MDYPSIPFMLTSTEKRADPVLLSVSRGGQPRARRLFDRPRREFSIEHRGLTDAQKQTVNDFLDANRLVPFTIYWPCRIGGVPYSLMEKTGECNWSKADGAWSTSIAVIES